MSNSPVSPFSKDELINSYMYILGRYLVIRQEKLDLAEPGITYNVLKHNPPVVEGKAGDKAPAFVNPNLEVVYSEAWIAVDEKTPAILEIPVIPAGLYYTAQIVDEWAEIITNINERNYPKTPAGKFALCLKDSQVDLPENCTRIDLPSKKAKLLFRVEIRDDLQRAVNLQKQLRLNSLGQPQIEPVVPIKMFTNEALPGAEIFAQPNLDLALQATDACDQKTVFHPLLRKIAEYVDADQSNFQQIDQQVKTVVIPYFYDYLLHFSPGVNGWSSTKDHNNFGSDYKFRAVVNYGGIWWNSSQEAVYFMLHFDADGQKVDGGNFYTIRFGADWLPQDVVKAYWSATVYSKPDYKLIPNEISRYRLSYMSDLVKGEDGSLIFYLGPTKPADAPENNWLPTPAGKEFTIAFRLYLPTERVFSGEWFVPGLVKKG